MNRLNKSKLTQSTAFFSLGTSLFEMLIVLLIFVSLATAMYEFQWQLIKAFLQLHSINDAVLIAQNILALYPFHEDYVLAQQQFHIETTSQPIFSSCIQFSVHIQVVDRSAISLTRWYCE